MDVFTTVRAVEERSRTLAQLPGNDHHASHRRIVMACFDPACLAVVAVLAQSAGRSRVT